MRNIKFRGLSLDTNKWAHGDLLQPGVGNSDALICRRYSVLDDFVQAHEALPVYPETVGQFVGEYDKRKREIYEDDILRVVIRDRFTGQPIASGVALVGFETGRFGVWWGCRKDFTTFSGFCNTEFEIIGNRYDNPELLEGNQ